MICAIPGQMSPKYDECRYDGSRLLFRGPRRALDGEYIACLGGTETFGKFIQWPYPDLLEETIGITSVNFGWPNAGIDVFANDSALLDCVGRARLTVLQALCAVNMSNMYYRVHPRRNDRFLQATDSLHALFPEVDFTEFNFTRHMLGRLQEISPERFGYIRQELAALWVSGMRDLVKRIGGPVVLLWFSARSPDDADDRPDIWADPALVSRDMLEALREDLHGIIELKLPDGVRGANPGRAPSRRERRAAREALGPNAHYAAAGALEPVITDLLRT